MLQTSSEKKIALTLDNIVMSYGQGENTIKVLKGVHLDVAKGTSVAITGPSGAGKSTLLMLLAGLEKPVSGKIILDGHEMTTMADNELTAFRGRNIGIVFQSFHLIPTMTAQENVEMPLDLAGDQQARDKARQALQDVGLGQRLSHYPSQLSGGEQQRVAVARALAVSPAIVVADEPTGNLDEKTGDTIADLLFDQVRQNGSSLVLVTHDMALARRCDRVLSLHLGQIEDYESKKATS
jgi:putative ABC transport system ATP-binding protein